jgi:cell volume regulation protein A
MAFETILMLASFFLIASVCASKASDKLGFPSLLLFLVMGMLAGSEGLFGIEFDNAQAAQFIGVVALVYILFYGGMDTDWKTIKPVVGHGISLATVGVLLTTSLVAVFATLVLDFSWLQGVLLGAIVSSTDAAAVFSILRSRGLTLKGKVRPIIEFESGSNDPMAIFLTMSMVALIAEPQTTLLSTVIMFMQQMTLGTVMGLAGGTVLSWSLNALKLSYDGLYPVFSLAMVMLIFSVTQHMDGNGFLAVYLAGLVTGNSRVTHRRNLTQFHDGIAWLMQITMFFVLGLLVFPSQLVPVAFKGFLVAAFLMLVARPMAVFLALSPFRVDFKERLFVSWVGLRGAVPIILATFPLLADTPNAQMIFNMVFFVVLASIAVQGTFLGPVARRLNLQLPQPTTRPSPFEISAQSNLQSEVVTLDIHDESAVIGKQVMDLELPKETLIMLAGTSKDLLPPTGRTVFKTGDKVVLLAKKSDIPGLQKIFGPQSFSHS